MGRALQWSGFDVCTDVGVLRVGLAAPPGNLLVLEVRIIYTGSNNKRYDVVR